jgi:hypothetical protein
MERLFVTLLGILLGAILIVAIVAGIGYLVLHGYQAQRDHQVLPRGYEALRSAVRRWKASRDARRSQKASLDALAQKASLEALPHWPGPGTYEFRIMGASKYQAALEWICGGRTEESAQYQTEAVLCLEDSNPHDNKAVRVDIKGQTVGYLSREDARSYRARLKQLGQERTVYKCNALVVGGWRRSGRSRKDQGHFGVRLDLPFPME